MSNGILLHRCHNQERKSRFLFGQPAFGNVCPKATKLKEVAVQENYMEKMSRKDKTDCFCFISLIQLSRSSGLFSKGNCSDVLSNLIGSLIYYFPVHVYFVIDNNISSPQAYPKNISSSVINNVAGEKTLMCLTIFLKPAASLLYTCLTFSGRPKLQIFNFVND
jgi:hypothetical protein